MTEKARKLETLRQWLHTYRNIVFFGGAGVSTESGIPDFRSVDGLYSQSYSAPPEEILSHCFFEAHPDVFYRFYQEKMLALDAEPNAAHRALARLEQTGCLRAVITQNIDGLHQKAGSKAVFELHGSVHRNTCLQCGKRYDGAYVKASGGIPYCTCGGMLKPDVVLYQEQLDDAVVSGAVAAIQAADLLLVGGTSLAVYPAAGLLRFFHGERLVVINLSQTAADAGADLCITDKIGSVFSQVTD